MSIGGRTVVGILSLCGNQGWQLSLPKADTFWQKKKNGRHSSARGSFWFKLFPAFRLRLSYVSHSITRCSKENAARNDFWQPPSRTTPITWRRITDTSPLRRLFVDETEEELSKPERTRLSQTDTTVASFPLAPPLRKRATPHHHKKMYRSMYLIRKGRMGWMLIICRWLIAVCFITVCFMKMIIDDDLLHYFLFRSWWYTSCICLSSYCQC
jgi:hypothetical protein